MAQAHTVRHPSKSSEAGSAGVKQMAEEVSRGLTHVPNAHHPKDTAPQAQGASQVCGLRALTRGSSPSKKPSPSPANTPYLERLTYPYYRVQIVAIITEKKLILSFRDITDVDVYLEQKETVSA